MSGQLQVPPADPPSAAAAQPGPLPLEELLEHAGGGDRQAFTELYDATAAQAFGVALRLTCNRTNAEDAVQAAYGDIWSRGASFNPRQGSALGWILMVVHAETVKQMRAKRSHGRRTPIVHHGARPSDQPRHDPPKWDPVLTSPAGKRVRYAFDRMTAVQREMVQWAYFDGYTHNQIDQLVGVPVGTAKIAIRDGLIALRDLREA